jgi:hypothetical protein
MAYRATKTEHPGVKKDVGFWDPKAEAKQHSSRIRRRDDARVVDFEIDTVIPDFDERRDVKK